MRQERNSFGQDYQLTIVDKFGIWLSTRRIMKLIRRNGIRSMADVGCGYDARLSRQTRGLVQRSIAVDLSLSPELLQLAEIETIEGVLPGVLDRIEPKTIELIVMNAVLEHLDEPITTLTQIRGLLQPGGILFVNVPSWFGKKILEFFAFRLGVSPAEEMEDHRRYYNKRELWIEIRAAGFAPSKIKIRRHKFGGAVFAIVRL